MSNQAISTKFQCTPSSVHTSHEQKGMVKDHLPPAVYRVAFNPFQGYYLSIVSELFKTPKKLYGVEEMPIQEIMDAYNREDKQMGVLLAGTKGAGKTLLSQILCNRMIQEQDTPVVLVDTPFSDQGFFDFVNDLGSVVIVFDEFAKVYGADQKNMLTFFDGSNVQCKRMSIVIENSVNKVSDFMVDRPSRFLFRLTYDKLSKTVVQEMCEDYNLTSEQTRDVKNYAACVYNLSTDMLKAILTYVTSTDVKVSDALRLLNVPVALGFRASSNTAIEVTAIVCSKTGEKDKLITKCTDNFINDSAISVNRISNRKLKNVEEQLIQYIEEVNTFRKEEGEPLLSEKEIETRRSLAIMRESFSVRAYMDDTSIVHRYREETDDWVIGIPDAEVVIVYKKLHSFDMEEIINSL